MGHTTEVIFAQGFSPARLEAPQLHTCALAMGKLRVDDVNVIRAFQKEVLADLSALHTNSLPPVLESGPNSQPVLGKLQRPHVATEHWNHGVLKGNHPQTALVQVSEICKFTQNRSTCLVDFGTGARRLQSA